MVQEQVVRNWDDYEKAKGHEYPATVHVEVSLMVKDFDGKVIPTKSLGTVELDCNDANLDTLVSTLGPTFKLPDAVKTPVRGSGGSTPRRSSGGGSGSSKPPSRSSETAAHNLAIREWAKGRKEFAGIKAKGRLPGEVIDAFNNAPENQEGAVNESGETYIGWERDFYPSRFNEDGSRKQDEAPATAQAPDVEPGPAPENVERPQAEEDDQPDPPMEQTNDQDWTRAPAPEPQRSGDMAFSYGQ